MLNFTKAYCCSGLQGTYSILLILSFFLYLFIVPVFHFFQMGRKLSIMKLYDALNPFSLLLTHLVNEYFVHSDSAFEFSRGICRIGQHNAPSDIIEPYCQIWNTSSHCCCNRLIYNLLDQYSVLPTFFLVSFLLNK